MSTGDGLKNLAEAIAAIGMTAIGAWLLTVGHPHAAIWCFVMGFLCLP